MAEEKQTDPLTGESLSLEELIPNRNLKEAIRVWKSLDAQWKMKAEQTRQLKMILQKQEQELSVSNTRFLKNRFKIEQSKKASQHHEIIDSIPAHFVENECVRDAMAYIANGNNYREAIKKYEKLQSQFPDDDWVYHQLGWLYLKHGNELSDINLYYTAVDFAEKAFEINPKNDAAYQLCGWIVSRIRLLTEDNSLKDKEIACYNRALQLNSKNPNTLENLGLYYYWGTRFR